MVFYAIFLSESLNKRMPRTKKQPVKIETKPEELKPFVPDTIEPPPPKRKKKNPNDLKPGEIIVERGQFFVRFD